MSAGTSETGDVVAASISQENPSSIVGDNGPATSEPSDPLNWNIDGVEDKNPFSEFSEEHLSKLDEFLSSEEARKILQQTTEGDFSASMSGLAPSESAQGSGEDFLKLDLLDGGSMHSAHLDHAYCLRSPKPDLASLPGAVTSSSKVVVVPMPTAVTESLYVQAPTAMAADGGGEVSPRKSARISLRRDQDEKVDDSKPGPLHPGFVGAVHPGIVQPQHAGMPALDIERGRGRGRRSLIPDDRLDTPVTKRRSSRISDQEQRDLAEKIRQENIQKEKEALEAMRKKDSVENDKAVTEQKTPPRKGRGGQKSHANDQEEKEGEGTDIQPPQGIKAAIARKVPKRGRKAAGQETNLNENESDENTINVKQSLSSPRVSARATKGKKAKRFAEEMEKAESPTKKGGAAKGEKGKDLQESEDEESEEETQKKGRGKKAGKKNESVDSETDTPKQVKKKGRGRKGQAKVKAESESDSEDEPLVKSSKKKTPAKDMDDESEEDESEDESVKGKGKEQGAGKKGKVSKKEIEEKTSKKKTGKKGKGKKEEDESDNEEVEVKKGKKKGAKGKKGKQEESDDDSEDDEDVPLQAGKKNGKAAGKVKAGAQTSPKGGTKKKGKKKTEEEGDDDEGEEGSDSKDSTPPSGKGKKGKVVVASPRKGRLTRGALNSADNTDTKKTKGASPKGDKSKAKSEENQEETANRSIFNVLEQDILPAQSKAEDSASGNSDGQNLVSSGEGQVIVSGQEVPNSSNCEKEVSVDPGVEEINYEDFISKIGSGEGFSESSHNENKKPSTKRQNSKEGSKQGDEASHHHHHHHHHHHSKDKGESDHKSKDQSQDHGEQKMPKHVKKKPRKSEDVVDPSVMDLFKPDVVIHEDSPASKKKQMDTGEKKDTPGLTRKNSSESGPKDTPSGKRRTSESEGQKDRPSSAGKKSNEGNKKDDGAVSHVVDIGNSEIKKEVTFDLPASDNVSEKLSCGADKTSDGIKPEKEQQITSQCDTLSVDSENTLNSAKVKENVKTDVSGINSKVKVEVDGVKQSEAVSAKSSQIKTETQVTDANTNTNVKHASSAKGESDVKKNSSKLTNTSTHKEPSDSKTEKVKLSDSASGSVQKEEKVVKFSEKGPEILRDKKSDKSTVKQTSPEDRKKRQLSNMKSMWKKHNKSTEAEVNSDERDSSDEDGNLSFEDDENDSDYEAPDEKYCICQQPYGKRFMICCDKCENWYHGSCVGITRVRGKEMEKDNEEYICPVCKGEDVGQVKQKKDAVSANKPDKDTQKSESQKPSKTQGNKVKLKDKSKGDSMHNENRKSIEGKDSHDVKASTVSRKPSGEKEGGKQHSDGTKSSEGNKTPRRPSKEGIRSGSHGDQDKSKSEGKEGDIRTPGKHNAHKRHSQDSAGHDAKRLKSSHHVDTAAQRCVVPGCNRYTKRYSVYCSTDCIHKHARNSIRLIHKQDSEEDKKNLSLKKITVIEKKSGRVLSGQSAPLETSLKSWLEQHPTFQVLLPRGKMDSTSKDKDRHRDRDKSKSKQKDSKDGEKKEQDKTKDSKEGSSAKTEKSKEESNGPDIVRLNVRKSLRDALLHRAEGADDIMLSNNEIRSTALKIEEELFKFFKETSHKYKAKYRSLVFNIKDSRNQGLFRKILNGHIRPYKLVRMSPEELASRELAKWREFEAKHQLEMIEQVEKEHMKEKEHIVKKTHKGEIDMDEDLSTLEDKGVEPKHKSTEAQPTTPSEDGKKDPISEFIVDTTSQHKMHLFDLNCKICTGKMAPPLDESPPKKVTVVRKPSVTETDKDSADKADKKRTYSDSKPSENATTKDVLKVTSQSKPDPPKVDSTVTVRSPDSALQSGLEKPKFKPSGPQLWKGFIQMQDVAKFVTTAYRVSGPCEKLDIPDTVHVCGRIAPEQILDYLAKMKKIGTKDMVILRFIPGSDEEKTSYINLYSYLNSRSRCGVVGNKAKHIKDFYILPLASHSKIPAVLQPFDGPGLEENRPHMLLAVIVKQKSKRHSSSDSDRSEQKKSKLESKSAEEKSRTPPVAGEKGSHKTHSSSKYKSASRKESPRSGVKPSPGSSSATSTPTSTSAGSTPGKNTPRASVDSHDPIVQVYGSSGALAEDLNDESTNSPSTSKKLTADDIPYDPEDDSQLPYKQSRPATVSTNKVPQQAKEPPKSAINQLLQQIAKCNNPAEATAITVASIATLPSVQEKRKFLLDLTSQVEAEKKLLEQKLVSTLTARTLVSAIYAISAASKTVVPASKMIAVQGQITPTPPATQALPLVSTATVAAAVVTSSEVQPVKSTPVTTATTEASVISTETSVVPTNSLKKESTEISAKAEKSVTFSDEITITTTTANEEVVLSGATSLTSDITKSEKIGKSVETTEVKVGSELESGDMINQNNSNSSSEVITDGGTVAPPLETKPFSSTQIPEALKSLFSFIPGSNFSHLSNIKESNTTAEPETTVDLKGEVATQSSAPQKSEPKSVESKVETKADSKKSSQHSFNVSLLDFDYGDSDSDEDAGASKSNLEPETKALPQEDKETMVLPFEKEIAKFEEEMSHVEETTAISDAERDRELMPPPPPLPKDYQAPPPPLQDLPPLPPEPPPPLPEHEPEEEIEEENKKKKKKKKPPPEIVLQPTNPVGKAILEATFLKLEKNRQEMVVPPPPLPPIALSSPMSQSAPMSAGVIGQSPAGMPIAMQAGMSAGPSIPVQGGIQSSMANPMPMTGNMLPQPPAVAMVSAPPPTTGPVFQRPPLPPPPQQPRSVRPPSQGIPSIFDLDVAPTKDFDSTGRSWPDSSAGPVGDHSGNWVEDEALTLPLEDQDLRKDQDFRQSVDVDERKKTWGDGQRQKFPPPWAQDVDHRNKGINKGSTGSVSSSIPPSEQHSSANDRDFRKYDDVREDNDYRKKDIQSDSYDLGYPEDQDYRGQSSRHHKRRKKRRYKSRSENDSSESYKKSRRHSGGEEDGEDISEESEASSRLDKKTEGKDNKKSEKCEDPPPRPHRMDIALPVPVPPPGVIPSSPKPPGSISHLIRGPRPPHPMLNRNPPPTDSPSRPPPKPGMDRGNYPPYIRPPPPPNLHSGIKKGQPLPPGVDPWDG